jgi:superfamily I DNA/RNA helicase
LAPRIGIHQGWPLRRPNSRRAFRSNGCRHDTATAARDEADQARYVVERILENHEEAALLKQQAVLFRTSSHSGPLEVELTHRNIPFVKFGGLQFLDAAHVKDVLAYFMALPPSHIFE